MASARRNFISGGNASTGSPSISNDQAFNTEFDAGNFDVLVIESSRALLPAGVRQRTLDWLAGGGKIIFSYWDLDGDAALRTALDVDVLASYDTPLPVVSDPAAVLDIFTAIEDVPDPIALTDPMIDDGDELELEDQGDVLARYGDGNGSAAVLRTNGGNAITLGFLPIGMVFEGVADADNDGKGDVTELYTNLLGAICNRIP